MPRTQIYTYMSIIFGRCIEKRRSRSLWLKVADTEWCRYIDIMAAESAVVTGQVHGEWSRKRTVQRTETHTKIKRSHIDAIHFQFYWTTTLRYINNEIIQRHEMMPSKSNVDTLYTDIRYARTRTLRVCLAEKSTQSRKEIYILFDNYDIKWWLHNDMLHVSLFHSSFRWSIYAMRLFLNENLIFSSFTIYHLPFHWVCT